MMRAKDGKRNLDEFLGTSHPDSCQQETLPHSTTQALGKRIRIEHRTTQHGERLAGPNVGKSEPYDHLPFFYCDMFDLGYEDIIHNQGQ
jgi:hypothetical protein